MTISDKRGDPGDIVEEIWVTSEDLDACLGIPDPELAGMMGYHDGIAGLGETSFREYWNEDVQAAYRRGYERGVNAYSEGRC